MSYTIIFTPEAEEQLAAIYHYIATAASPKIAERYTNAIVSYCEGLTTFPHRSAQHNEIRPGLLLTNYKKRVVIAYTVEVETISIIGVFYGGQDYQATLDPELDS
jgi:plasmid stabilization system protein ParE